MYRSLSQFHISQKTRAFQAICCWIKSYYNCHSWGYSFILGDLRFSMSCAQERGCAIVSVLHRPRNNSQDCNLRANHAGNGQKNFYRIQSDVLSDLKMSDLCDIWNCDNDLLYLKYCLSFRFPKRESPKMQRHFGRARSGNTCQSTSLCLFTVYNLCQLCFRLFCSWLLCELFCDLSLWEMKICSSGVI